MLGTYVQSAPALIHTPCAPLCEDLIAVCDEWAMARTTAIWQVQSTAYKVTAQIQMHAMRMVCDLTAEGVEPSPPYVQEVGRLLLSGCARVVCHSACTGAWRLNMTFHLDACGSLL
jgi:hypothetical protein